MQITVGEDSVFRSKLNKPLRKFDRVVHFIRRHFVNDKNSQWESEVEYRDGRLEIKYAEGRPDFEDSRSAEIDAGIVGEKTRLVPVVLGVVAYACFAAFMGNELLVLADYYLNGAVLEYGLAWQLAYVGVWSAFTLVSIAFIFAALSLPVNVTVEGGGR